MPCYQKTIARVAKLPLSQAKRLTKREIRTAAQQLLQNGRMAPASYQRLISELDACETERVREMERVT